MSLLETALFAGGVYASLRVALTVLYPTFAGYCWQFLLGPTVAARWPALAQSEDQSRYSYLSAGQTHTIVWRFGLLPPPLDDVTHGLRDGFLLGVLVALVPDALTAGVLTAILGVVLARNAWRIARTVGAWRTDAAWWAGKDVLMYFCAVLAVQASGLL